jgi:hypothetical protein
MSAKQRTDLLICIHASVIALARSQSAICWVAQEAGPNAGKGLMMRDALLAILFLTMAGCAKPFVAVPNAATPAYIDCVNQYASTRIDYNVTAGDLADAAIGACQSKLEAVRQMYRMQLSAERSNRLADSVRDDARSHVVTVIVEARATPSVPR